MNDPPPPPNQNADDARLLVPLQADFTVQLGNVIRGNLAYSIHALQEALSEDTTVKNLTISFRNYEPTAAMQRAGRGLIQFLLHYIASRNNLSKLCLYDAIINGPMVLPLSDVLHQFVMAAVRSGKMHLSSPNTGGTVPCKPQYHGLGN